MHCDSIKNKNNMTKLDKSVEIAKETIEDYIIRYNEFAHLVYLPTKTEDLILELGSDWYFNLLLSAGYSHRTIERKVENMEFDRLVSKLDDWYKTEAYPKLYNKFKSEGMEIVDY